MTYEHEKSFGTVLARTVLATINFIIPKYKEKVV